MKVSNVNIYGLGESIRAAKFPKSTNTSTLTDELTEGIERLAEAPLGSGHDNWLNGVVVQFDLTASLEFWPQFQRYHFAEFVSSQSKMHRIMQFNIEEQCNEYVDPILISNLKRHVDEYNHNPSDENFYRVIYNIPTGFELTARMTTNYRQLKTMYAQRRHHRLPEWKKFCDWIKGLPHSELITGEAA